MKHNLLTLPLLALATMVAGCSTDAAGDAEAAATAITFSATARDSRTRSDIVSSAAEFATDGRQFRVWAWRRTQGESAEPLALYGADVTCQDGEWTTDRTYYWPLLRYTVDFYAVYPAAARFDPSTLTLDYTTQGIDGQTDLMYASAVGMTRHRFDSDEELAVSLNFDHALSSIEIRKEALNGIIFNIAAISLGGIQNKAAFSIATASWTADDAQNPSTATYSDISFGTPILLLPQTLGNVAQITISYYIQKEENGVVQDMYGSATDLKEKTLTLTGSWLAGYRYTYTFIADEKYSISLQSAIRPWGTPDEEPQRDLIL